MSLLLVLAFYFLPSMVAMGRKHRLAATIFVVNLFLGWTVLGWIIALAMAVGPATKEA